MENSMLQVENSSDDDSFWNIEEFKEKRYFPNWSVDTVYSGRSSSTSNWSVDTVCSGRSSFSLSGSSFPSYWSVDTVCSSGSSFSSSWSVSGSYFPSYSSVSDSSFTSIDSVDTPIDSLCSSTVSRDDKTAERFDGVNSNLSVSLIKF